MRAISDRREASQQLPLQPMELCFVDALEADSVAGAQGEVAVGHVDKLQGCPADQVPAAGPALGIDSSLAPGQTDAARIDTESGLRQARHAAQRGRQIAQVRKAGAEADG